MELRTFKMKMVDYYFAELPGGVYLFKRKHGIWCVWNSETDEEKEFDFLQAVLPFFYKRQRPQIHKKIN